MPQLTLTLDLSHETVDALHALVDRLSGTNKPETTKQEFDAIEEQEDKIIPSKKTGARNTKGVKDTKDEKASTASEEKESSENPPKISLTDVRAVALLLSKAGKQSVLKEIFAKYGAEKLSDISEDNYAELLADLEETNG
jgi:hypothetical protein